MDQGLVRALADIFYSRDMPVRVRLGAIAKLVGIDQMPPGTALNRKICIWDIAGRNGPVFQAAMEQRAMALEYGSSPAAAPQPQMLPASRRSRTRPAGAGQSQPPPMQERRSARRA